MLSLNLFTFSFLLPYNRVQYYSLVLHLVQTLGTVLNWKLYLLIRNSDLVMVISTII